MKILMTVFALAFGLLLAGCASLPESPRLDRTRSHLDPETAAYLAQRNAQFLDGEATHIRGTGSMGAEFYRGQWVILDRNWNGIEPDYIISFNHEGERIIHRALRYHDGAWMTNGDRKGKVIWVEERDYNGTLVGKFYHRRDG